MSIRKRGPDKLFSPIEGEDKICKRGHGKQTVGGRAKKICNHY